MNNADERWGDLPTGTLDNVRRSLKLVEKLRSSDRTKDVERELEYFFMMSLVPFYDCMYSGMEKDALHVVYRLSDSVPEDFRKEVLVYPGDGNGKDSRGSSWHTLEDFRKEWEGRNLDGIPEMCKLLPEGQL